MAKNHVIPGDIIAVTLGATYASDDLIKVGDIAGVVISGGVSGDTRSVAIAQVFTVPKRSGAVFGQGDTVYLDAANKRVDDTSNSGANIVAGKAIASAASGTTSVAIKLNI